MFSVTKNGKPLSKSKYTWDEKEKIFRTQENDLVLDFFKYDRVTFNTSFGCTFITGSYCTFDTGSDCTFKTSSDCTFKTGENCFVTRYDVNGCDEIPEGKTIKLNGHAIRGYTIIDEPKLTCNGKVVEIDGKKYKLVEIEPETKYYICEWYKNGCKIGNMMVCLGAQPRPDKEVRKEEHDCKFSPTGKAKNILTS